MMLWYLRGEVGVNGMDLYEGWPNEQECFQVQKALEGAEVEVLKLVVNIGSPWLQVDAWIHMVGNRALALWRATGAVYAVDKDGAVGDDPIVAAAWESRHG
jgi:hypothetical protein